MAFLTGLPGVRGRIQRLPKELTGVLRGAARAGGKVYQGYIDRNTPSDAVREALRIRTTLDDGHVKTTVDVKPGWGRTVANWLEWGTSPHFISVDDSQRGGRSIGRINQQVRDAKGDGSLVIGGKFVGATVWHPGTRPEPVFRAAEDLNRVEAIRAAQAYINTHVTRRGIISTDPGDDE